MDVQLNTTMDYVNLFLHYCHLEGVDLINAPLTWLNAVWSFLTNYQPCFNVSRKESIFLYILILLMKNFIVSHGMLEILPRYVSWTLFPALLVYYHYFLVAREPVACVFTMWNFAFIWTLLWQCPYLNITGKYVLFIVCLTIGVVFLEVSFVGFQFALDVFIVLIIVWFVARSFLNRRFNITFIIFACSFYYFSLGRAPLIPEVFYLFLFLLFLGLYGGYVSSRGDDEEMLFFLSVATGIVVLMSYNIAVYGFSGPDYMKAGKEDPFNRLPTYSHPPSIERNQKFVKDSLDKFEDPVLDSREYASEKLYGYRKALLDDSIEVVRSTRRTVDKPAVPKVAKPEVESVIFTPDAEGSLNLSVGMRVKYRTNETMPTMLF